MQDRADENLRQRLRDVAPQTFMFRDDGVTPNNPALPLLVYNQAVDLSGTSDPAAIFEKAFSRHGWGDSWRDGIYPYLHYHSAIHEVLGVAQGRARVRFGGDGGAELDLTAGDVAVLPAGTGHQRLTSSPDFLVVGAYPPAGTYDECRGSLQERARAHESVPRVPLPDEDPLFGPDGPLRRLWKRD